MNYTLGTLRRLGLEKEFVDTIKRWIPKTVNDQEAKQYVVKVLEKAEDGLVGTQMMRQMAYMRINRAVEPGLYAEIIRFHARAAEMMRKQEEEKRRLDESQSPEETEEAPEIEATEEASKTEDSIDSPDEKEAETKEFEGLKYRTAPHPMKPKSIAKYGDDFLYPVPPERLWNYKTALYKTFKVLVQKPRKYESHFRSCARKGVTKAQFERAWRTWKKDGKKIGWKLIEDPPDYFQLIAQEPLTGHK